MSRSAHSHGQLRGGDIRNVHCHDVLSGRGVNIAQHPGNERFRALVNTRYDESYCSTFSTSEKRALANEIIDHIKALDPPGRFLKRNGKSHSNRGLLGPWEELTPKEIMKKTCQALRDCNRNDRTGYAVAVTVPRDVIQNAQQRSMSGLTLKQHAAAAVARSKTPGDSLEDTAYHRATNELAGLSNFDRKPAPNDHGSAQETGTGFHSTRHSPSSIDDSWLKHPDTIDSLPQHEVVTSSPRETAVGSYMGGPVRTLQPPSAVLSYHATPTAPPQMASVPVTNTPMQYSIYHHHHYSAQHHDAPGPLLQPPPMPTPHSPGFYYAGHGGQTQRRQASGKEDSHVRIVSIPAPYSPLVWNRHNANEDVDDCAEPVPMSAWKDEPDDNDPVIEDVAAAAALMNGDTGRSDFDLLGGDDLPQDDVSLTMDELE
jgi:hypothetical protein